MTEVLNSMKLLKMYAWEEPFQHTISGKWFVTYICVHIKSSKWKTREPVIVNLFCPSGSCMFIISPQLSQVFVVFCTILLFVLFSFRIVLQLIFSNIAPARQSPPELLFFAFFYRQPLTELFYYSYIASYSSYSYIANLYQLSLLFLYRQPLPELSSCSYIANSTGVIVPARTSSTSTGVIVSVLMSLVSTWVIIPALTSSTSTGFIVPALALKSSTSTGVIVPALTSSTSTGVIVPTLISATFIGVILPCYYIMMWKDNSVRDWLLGCIH